MKDRSGKGLPPKAERRALGKAAARKRAVARRRRQLLNRVAQIVGPIVAVGLIIGVVWLFGRGGSPTDTATPQASTSPTVAAEPEPTLPAALSTRPEVTAGEGTLSELKVTTLVEGTGAPVEAGQTLTVNYVGAYYATGEVFEASWDGGTPANFPIGVGSVIPGWDQGLVGVPIGSRVQLDIPAALAYEGVPDSPQGDLRFVVDVLDAS